MKVIAAGREPVSRRYGQEFGAEILDYPILHLPPALPWEGVVVLSPHVSASGFPCLTVHYPGNPGPAVYGGKSGLLSLPLPDFAAEFILNCEVPPGFSLTYEADHHGPSSATPMAFVEIGSTEAQWYRKDAMESLFSAVEASLNPTQKETFLGVSKSHYPKPFTLLTQRLEIAFSHIIALHSYSREALAAALVRCLRRPKGIILDDFLPKRVKREVRAFGDERGLEVLRAGELM